MKKQRLTLDPRQKPPKRGRQRLEELFIGFRNKVRATDTSRALQSKPPSTPTASGSSPKVDPFVAARETFFVSLGPRERALFTPCTSVTDLLTCAREIPGQIQEKGLRVSMLDTLTRFANRLNPYFDVVGIFVQTHPEFAGLAWGAVRLALQVCEKITLDSDCSADTFSFHPTTGISS